MASTIELYIGIKTIAIAAEYASLNFASTLFSESKFFFVVYYLKGIQICQCIVTFVRVLRVV